MSERPYHVYRVTYGIKLADDLTREIHRSPVNLSHLWPKVDEYRALGWQHQERVASFPTMREARADRTERMKKAGAHVEYWVEFLDL